MSHRIAVIGGDGIGPQIVADAMKVVRATGIDISETEFDVGAARYMKDGFVLSDEMLADIKSHDAILKGPLGPPVGDTSIPGGTIERGIILRLRFELDQYINLRPFTAPRADGSTLDFVVVRENTEGPYAGEGGFLRKGTPQEIATQGSVNTRHGVERCVRFAFELAMSRPRRHLTMVHKTNVLTYAGDLWNRTFNDVAREYPDVTTAYNHVDASTIYLHDDPGRYDVIVTDNLFGDIITDLAGAVTGGVGLAASANLNPDRTAPSMFEPVHGAAHDALGTDGVNPTATILAAAHMVEFLGEADAGARIRKAVADVLATNPTPKTIGDLVTERL
ncbi:MAG TPA: 3-isopropylmalate dehydrogenase [Acidimicrobiales bacterium]|nr:3-isopropylmalate dehydrogenase [Acidimicrobiales bacterium]